MRNQKNKPKKSLRTILILWFLLFSIIPLGFVSYYSISRFEKAINYELSQRLFSNAREISSIISDYRYSLEQRNSKIGSNPRTQFSISTNEVAELRKITIEYLQTNYSAGISFYNFEGRLILSATKNDNKEAKVFLPSHAEAIYLNENYIEKLNAVESLGRIDSGDISLEKNKKEKDSRINLIVISKIINSSGKKVGYIQNSLSIDASILEKIKNRMKIELISLNENKEIASATNKDFYLVDKLKLKNKINNSVDGLIDYTIENQAFEFLIYPIQWEKGKFYIGLGVSKEQTYQILKNINIAFLTVVGAVIVLLLISVFFISNLFLKPLYDLLEGINSFEVQEQAVSLPIRSQTEIGLLTERFNELSRKVSKSQIELRQNIFELEKKNIELKEAQSQLVQSAKMVSLGQIVAGVAHELNNPIGFIYSNVSHLKEYTENLFNIIESSEDKNPDVDNAKKKYDYDYIKSDLPKLIKSYEDGANRVKEIVLGLRNFSRLEESKVKEININEHIDMTLELLSSLSKNKVIYIKNYSELPLVNCYASEINQVLMNILSNSIQAIKDNGKIWISTSLKKKNSESQIVISIQDNGVGISADNLEKIFDPFFTTKDVGQGTGLGLSISYGIIQKHGGEIKVKSEVGVGTEFIIEIPTRLKPHSS